jgi:hypothetical protein
MSDDKRVSNRQILDALTDLPSAIASAIAGTAAPVAIATPADETVGNDQTASIDAAYLSHVASKLQTRANDTGKDYVLYARVNVAGQTKLAYCEADKWSGLKDKRIIGPVKTVSPE